MNKRSMHVKKVLLFFMLEVVCSWADAGKKLFYTCGIPLDKDGCPRTDHHKKLRENCLTHYQGCPLHKHYLCGKVKETGIIVEICNDIYSCPEGSSVTMSEDQHTKNISLNCHICDEEHFQSVPSDSSSGYLEGCTQPRYNDAINNGLKSERLVRYSIGWPSGEDEFRCNSNQGWSNQNGVLDCTTSYPCNCVNYVKCENETYLLPDGSCVSCDEMKKINPNFNCDRKKRKGEEFQSFSKDKMPVADKTPVDEGGGWPIKYVILVGAVLVVIVIGGIVYCRKGNHPLIVCSWKVFQNHKNYLAKYIAKGTNATMNVTENDNESAPALPHSDQEDQQHRMNYIPSNPPYEMESDNPSSGDSMVTTVPQQPHTEAVNTNYTRDYANDGANKPFFQYDENETSPKCVS